MSMKRYVFAVFLFLILFLSCQEKPLDPSKPVYVTIATSMGNVTVLLYDDTPLHRDNFIKLCRSDAYKDVLFHRFIKEFVVQGGDPASKAHQPGVLYGDGDGGYTIPAEIRSDHMNKRGALIDAKESDEVNPERASAGTQFCFVQGKIWNDDGLDVVENRINNIRRNWLYYKFMKEEKEKNPSLSASDLENEVLLRVEDSLAVCGPAVISPERREVYKTIGGVPHLDGSVTVFGEVVEGLEIVEKMSQVGTDKNDRPLKDIFIKSTRVFQK